ncbi:ABC transporter substrate-binding protein [Paenibacillus sp. PL2-23]|uniref:ABC transporter substrate-binding protein n=1 Tax=Paenibacillus sp. PL2-23 TaxID=2100729 RepID=UPI0030F8256C
MRWKIKVLLVILLLSILSWKLFGGKQQQMANSNEVELTVAFPVHGAVSSEWEDIQRRVNQIVRSKLQVSVHFLPVNEGSWEQRIKLMLTGGEALDLVVVRHPSYYTHVAEKRLLPLQGLLDKYGKDIRKQLSAEQRDAGKVWNAIYAVPVVRETAVQYGILLREDLVNKYKVDVSSVQSLEDVEAVLKRIHELEPEIVPLVPKKAGSSILEEFAPYDPLGDGFAILPDYDNDGKVVNAFATEQYEQQIRLIREWYVSGLVHQESATNNDSAYELIRSGEAFAYLSVLHPGIEAQESRAAGRAMLAIPLTEAYSTTSSTGAVMWGIPLSSRHTDKAMQLLNLLYADSDIVNLLTWGIEGQHYSIQSDSAIDIPIGEQQSQWMPVMITGRIFGNPQLAYSLEDEPSNLWERLHTFGITAKRSYAYGFNFYAKPVQTEIAAVEGIAKQYRLGLESGVLDPEIYLEEMLDQLQQAGIERLVNEKQNQLDEWSTLQR